LGDDAVEAQAFLDKIRAQLEKKYGRTNGL
jgi:hypothetical protein